MPLGEIIAHAVGEIVIYNVTYWTGYAFLSVASLGQLEMAPLSTVSEKNKGKSKWYQIDWSVWLRKNGKKKALKAECVISVGLALWIIVGILVFLTLSSEGSEPGEVVNASSPAGLPENHLHD